MKLTVVFMLVTLGLCCYSASALLEPLSLVSNVVPNLVPNVVENVISVPVGVLTDVLGGVQGCANQLTPAALSAVNRLLGILKLVG